MENLGDCYPAAFGLFTENKFPLPAVLCHGVVTRTSEGSRFGHAWVELILDHGFIVLDYSNNMNMQVYGPLYYKAGYIRSEEVRRYTLLEALDHAEAFEHFGYWDPWFDQFAFLDD